MKNNNFTLLNESEYLVINDENKSQKEEINELYKKIYEDFRKDIGEKTRKYLRK